MSNAKPVRFGEFTLDPLKRELRRGEHLVPLQNKAFECMVYLVSHRERAVGRDELIAAVWGSVDISDNLLDQMVLLARRAVGDNSRQRRVIRTIPHFGYCWIASIDEPPAMLEGSLATAMAAPAPSSSSASKSEVITETESAPATPARGPRSALVTSSAPNLSRYGAAVGAAVLIAMLAIVVARPWVPTDRRASVSPVAMVMPVAVIADPSNAWIRLGVMEQIADRLRRDGQPVMPGDDVIALFKGMEAAAPDAIDVGTLARTGGVDLVFSAVAEAADGQWRVTLKTAHGRSPALMTEAVAPDVLVAARQVADRMARELGLTPKEMSPERPDDEEMIRKAQAALLEDRVDEARAWLAKIPADSPQIADARYLTGRIELKNGHYDDARSLFSAVAATHARDDDPVPRARAIYGIATADSRQADLNSAAQHFDEAVALLENHHGPDADALLGRILTSRGYNHIRRLELPAADKDFMRARLLLESSADPIGLMQLDLDVGIAAVNTNRLVDAVPLLEQAARRAAAVHDVGSELRACIERIRVRIELAEPGAALALDPRLQELMTQVHEPKLNRFVQAWRARMLAANGRLSDAADALAQAMFNRAADEGGTAPSVGARLAWARADFDLAAADARTAIAVPLDNQDPRDTGVAWLILLRSQLATGQKTAAADTASAVADWGQKVDIAPAGLYAKLSAADMAAAVQSSAAPQLYRQAWSMANQASVPGDLLLVADSYTRYLIGTGDHMTAASVATRMAGWADRDFDAALLQMRLYHALNQPDAWRAALAQARALAGERVIPDGLDTPPATVGAR